MTASGSQLFFGFQRKISNGTCIYRLLCIEYTPDVLYLYNHLNRIKTNDVRGISVQISTLCISCDVTDSKMVVRLSFYYFLL